MNSIATILQNRKVETSTLSSRQAIIKMFIDELNNERDGKKSKLGFWQSNETRSMGGNTLEEWLNTYKIKITDKRIQKELETWVWKDGRRDHLPDKHDDFIMALTMCAYILRYVYGRYAKMKDKKESGALSVQRARVGLQRTAVYNKFDKGLDEEGFPI